MRHDTLKEWYIVNWGSAVNGALGAIPGIRRDDVRIGAGSIVPRQWFNLTPPGSLQYVINGLNVFSEYEPEDDDLLILYTCYPATKPGIRFANQSGDDRVTWYRVTRDSPAGVTALRSVDGICKAGDVAQPGTIIPSQWFSALTSEQINRLAWSGIQSVKWHTETLSEEQRELARHRVMPGVIVKVAMDKYQQEALYQQYPGAQPQFKTDIPETPETDNDNIQETD